MSVKGVSHFTRKEVVGAFVDGEHELDINQGDTLQALGDAGFSKRDLRRAAGRDGVFSSEAEYNKLFNLLDDLDHNGSRHSLAVVDPDAPVIKRTASGDALKALVDETVKQRLAAAVGGSTCQPVGQSRRNIGDPATAGGSVRQPVSSATAKNISNPEETSALKTTASARGLQTADGSVRAVPPWVETAMGELGVTERRGVRDNNPRIVEYHATTTLPDDLIAKDETPWCSSFANWVMEQAGYAGTGRADAESWEKWGQPLDRPALGAIATRKDGRHVGFVVGRQGDELILLGGNQWNPQTDTSNQVNFSRVRLRDDQIHFRVPDGYNVPAKDYDLPQLRRGRLNGSFVPSYGD